MLRYIAEEDLPHRVTLIYSNRDRESAAFLEELQQLERDRDNIRVVLTMTEDPGWEGETRHVDADFLRDHLENDLGSYTYLVAGPPDMVNGVTEKLQAAGVSEDQVRPARFSGY
jgi:NAD(P)H-flavin reductase